MAFGKLSGKYLQKNKPQGRISLFPQMSRYNNPRVDEAINAYANIAEKHGISLAQMSLAFVTQQDFTTSTIIGATTMEQLKENIESIHVNLSDEVLKDINKVHEQIPNPAP